MFLPYSLYRFARRAAAVSAIAALLVLMGCSRGSSYGGRPVGHGSYPVHGRPGSLEEAVALPLAEHTIVIRAAGGTEVLPLRPGAEFVLAGGLWEVYLLYSPTKRAPGRVLNVSGVKMRLGKEVIGLTKTSLTYRGRSRSAYFFKVADCSHPGAGRQWFWEVCGVQEVTLEVTYVDLHGDFAESEVLPPIYLAGG